MNMKEWSKALVGVCSFMIGSLFMTPVGVCQYKPDHVAAVFPATASVGYQAGTAQLSVLGKKTGVRFSFTPAGNSLTRISLLKTGKGHICLAPAGDVFLGLEGTVEFKDLGPQSLRTFWDCGSIDMGLAAPGNSGIKKISDIKGKRVATYPSYPYMDLCIQASLAYGNLTWKDVKPVKVSSFPAGMSAILDGAVDVAVVTGESAQAQEIAASFQGIQWVAFPSVTPADKEAWARFNKILPFYPNKSITAAGASKDKPVDIWGYNYQWTTYDFIDPNLIYWVTKQMFEGYDDYKGVHAYVKRWTPEWNLKPELWFAPRHEGTIRYLKEIGKWTPAMEAKNKEMLAKYPKQMTK